MSFIKGYDFIAFLERQKKRIFIVEMLTVQLVIYVNIDAILKSILRMQKKHLTLSKKHSVNRFSLIRC